MKNYEKYAEQIKRAEGTELCQIIVKPNVLRPMGRTCDDTFCGHCNVFTTLWLLEDYEEPKEPEVDWSKVEVDTPILVKMDEPFDWERKHFARYEDGKVCTWYGGATSWTATYDDITSWKYAKLAETEGAE